MVSEKVTTEEGKQLHDYEMVFIISPDIADESLEAAIGSVSNFITDRGGVIGEMVQWGKKRLAYPIKNIIEGHYVLAKFQMPPEAGKELETNLQISRDVLRHLLVKKDG